MIDNKKTVFTSGEYSIVREQYYGFRCNTLSTDWQIMHNGKSVWNYLRLKDAKKSLQAMLSK